MAKIGSSPLDHLQSSAHEEAIRLQENDEAWRSMSDSQPWARVMKKSKAETLNSLIHLTVDAYNDAQVETISARSWPSRFLAGEHRNHLVRLFSKEGWDSNFVPCNQPASLYHYRDPVTYGEMQEIIGKLEMKHVADCLKDCLCYSVQIDGSTDKQQIDCVTGQCFYAAITLTHRSSSSHPRGEESSPQKRIIQERYQHCNKAIGKAAKPKPAVDNSFASNAPRNGKQIPRRSGFIATNGKGKWQSSKSRECKTKHL